MKKNVKLITYCTWKSIGSILQAYALSSVLKSLGYDNELWLEEKSCSIEKNKPSNLKAFFKYGLELFIEKKINTAYKKRCNFIDNNMKVAYLSNYNDFLNSVDGNESCVYLAGSDQIWNPDVCNSIYFLDFAKKKRCISYAASMGNTKICQDKISFFKEKLNNFEFISVREQECAKVLSPCTNKDISVNIDPTFLVNTDLWSSIGKSYKIKKPYILLYMLYWNNSYKKQIIALKKRTGLPVYAICTGVSHVYADKHLFDVGVEEFLWLVENAEYVITSSFHGVAFSILFRKKFTPIINPKLPSRIENLLDILEVPYVSISELDKTTEFKYDTVFMNIEKERQRSINYLRGAIN